MPKAYASTVIDAPADRVWAAIRDFNGLPQWHPGIADSRIENSQPADRVGCIRHFHTRDGGTIRERLLALSDYEFSCVYEILESPMGVANYAVPACDVLPKARDVARDIATHVAPMSAASSKRLLWDTVMNGYGPRRVAERETDAHLQMMGSADAAEAVRAFTEKRAPRWN